MTDPKKDDLQQDQRNPNSQDNNPPQDSVQANLHPDGQEQQSHVQEEHEGATGHDDIYASPLSRSQRPAASPVLEKPSLEEEETPPPLSPREGISGIVQEEHEGAAGHDDIYASPLPKSQRPAASLVLEESLLEEEETSPPLPPREDISDIEEEEEDLLPPPPMEGEIRDFMVGQYNGPSIHSRDLIDEPYCSSDGDYAMEFEDNGAWEAVRHAVLNDKEVDPRVLTPSEGMKNICGKIIQSKGNLSEQEVENIVTALETNDQGVADDIFNPITCDVEDNPVREARGIMTLLHLAYAYNVHPKIISAIENTRGVGGYTGSDCYNLQDSDGNLPLHFAAKNCNGKMLSRCISNTRPDVINLRNFNNETPLHIVCQNPACSIENVQVAKECNADFSVADGMGRLSLHDSAIYSKPEVLACVLRNTKSSVGREDDVINMQDNAGYTPLHYAVMGGNSKVLPLILLQNGIDACKRDANGYMPIHHAVMRNDYNALKALCSSKTTAKNTIAKSLLSDDLRGNTPLHVACSVCDGKVFNVLKKGIQNCHGDAVFRESLLQEKVGGNGLDLSGFNADSGTLGSFKKLYDHLQTKDFVTSPVHAAIQHNNLPVLSLVAKYSPDLVKQESSTGVNSCHMAMLFGDPKTAKFIVNSASKAEVNAQSPSVPSPLYLACIRGNDNIVGILVSNKDLNINQGMGENQDTVLHYAIKKSNHKLAKKILDNPNLDVNVKNAAGNTPLHEAVDLGDLKVVKALCTAGADASILGSTNEPILLRAVFSGQKESRVIDTVKLLLDHGATLGSSEDKNLLLEKCVYSGYNRLLNTLLNHKGVPTYSSSPEYPLAAAVICNNMDAAKLLIRHGGDVNQRVPNPTSMHFGHTLLMVAVENSNPEMMKLLLQKKCDPNIAKENGATALHFVVTNQDKEFVKKALSLLMPHNAKPSLLKQDIHGNTPLHSAIIASNFSAASTIMRSTPKRELSKIAGIRNGEGNTLLHLAMQSGDMNIAKLLLNSLDKTQLGALLCTANEYGNTPLHLAMQNGNSKLALLMLKSCQKSDLQRVIEQQDVQGNTVLHLACKATADSSSLDTIVKLAVNKLDKQVLAGIVNMRNMDGNTPVHYALLKGSKYSSTFLPLCNNNTLALPNAEGKLLSDCINQQSIFRRKRGIFKLRASLFDSIVKSEARARDELSIEEVHVGVDPSGRVNLTTETILVPEDEGKHVQSAEIGLSGESSEYSLLEDASDSSLVKEEDKERHTQSAGIDSSAESSEYSLLGDASDSSLVEGEGRNRRPVKRTLSASSGDTFYSMPDLLLSDFEPSLLSDLSSFSTFGKGSSSDVSQSSDEKEVLQQIQEKVGDEIEEIVHDMPRDIVSESVDSQTVSPSSSQSTADKKSSCHSK